MSGEVVAGSLLVKFGSTIFTAAVAAVVTAFGWLFSRNVSSITNQVDKQGEDIENIKSDYVTKADMDKRFHRLDAKLDQIVSSVGDIKAHQDREIGRREAIAEMQQRGNSSSS